MNCSSRSRSMFVGVSVTGFCTWLQAMASDPCGARLALRTDQWEAGGCRTAGADCKGLAIVPMI